ncbi:uncharacterized protein L201_006313 [Kwoniella dendrophila CBS 6074]|uniref:FAS1 domain-containing protein n=1 Tax=Kwoniella dendrophila CBS 6074 TaxID=1295534 RepID=A0AAX4K3M7_9TREE
MWSTGLLVSVVLAARLGLSQQLAFSPSSNTPFDEYDKHISSANNAIDDDISTTAETIVSVLSSSSQHTITLHLLQRSKCIPLLAHISNATVFAPTDQAWNDWADKHKPQPKPEVGGVSYENDFIQNHSWLGEGGLEEWMESEDDVLGSRISQHLKSENYDNQSESHEQVAEKERLIMDNQNWLLRQHLLYHMLNYTLSPLDFLASQKTQNITIETSLLFPLAEEPKLPPVPEPGPPWLPKGNEGLLGGHGQRIRISKTSEQQKGKIGIDWNGENGIDFWDGKGWANNDDDKGKPHKNKTHTSIANLEKDKDKENKQLKGIRWTRNGVVVGIDGVLDMPLSIEQTIRTHPSLKYLSDLLSLDALPSPLPDSFSTSPHLTVFAPSDEAFYSAFDDIEKGYLQGPYGEEGVTRILSGGIALAVGKDHVGWSDFLGNRTLEACSGLDLVINSTQPGQISVNGTNVQTVDIFASNGVIHILPNLLIPENFTLLNSAEKVLLSLNATRFVSLLRSANLSDTYIGSSSTEDWTILAPTDDVLDIMDKWGDGWGAPIPEIWAAAEEGKNVDLYSDMIDLEELLEVYPGTKKPPIKDASPLASLLQYHILPGRLLPSDIKDGLLLGTELKPSSLAGGRQKLQVDVSDRFDRDKKDWEAIGEGEIRFGGATVIGKPVKTGKSIIYLLSSLLSPPDDVLQTAVSDLQLSTFIAAVYAAELDKAVKRTPATTFFMPRNRAFNQLGLAMRYLLSPEGKDELRKVIKYHAVNDVIYSPDIEYGKKVYTTLEGGSIVVDRTKGKNGSISLRSPTKWEGYDSGDTLPSNGELRSSLVWHSDALTSTGVIHTIDSVVMPSDVKITNAKLIRGSKQNTMGDLMMRAGLGWILEGREPTSGEISAAQLEGRISLSGQHDDKGEDGGDQRPAEGDEPVIEDLALPSYTILVPTDKAFSRINLTHYLNDKEALLDLLKLHIIPSISSLSSSSGNSAKLPDISPPKDGQPISLDDDLIYKTLLSDKSKFGELAFRATGDNSFIVGIKGARGNRDGNGNDNNNNKHKNDAGDGSGNSARIGQSGRSTVRWKKNYSTKNGLHFDSRSKGRYDNAEDESDEEEQSKRLWKDGMTLGGGVFMIDSVLIPYQPSWFSRWGWLVITLSGIGLVILIAGVSFGWWFMTRQKEEENQYEPLEGEEEE